MIKTGTKIHNKTDRSGTFSEILFTSYSSCRSNPQSISTIKTILAVENPTTSERAHLSNFVPGGRHGLARYNIAANIIISKIIKEKPIASTI
jgi:hypothetical protein